MNNELRDLDLRACGIESFDKDFSCNVTTRKNNQYTWNDLLMNLNTLPLETDMAIVVTSWRGHLKWLKASLASYRLSGKYVILSYDMSFLSNDVSLRTPEYTTTLLPNATHFLLAHSVVFKHKTYDADKRTGWFWDVKYARAIVNEFKNMKYVYVTNGDCCWDRPEGTKELIEILGDCDLMSGQSVAGGVIHTAAVLYKIEAFNKVVDYMTERMKVSIIGSQSPEHLLMDAVKALNLKVKEAPKQPIGEDGTVDYYTQTNQDSTWKDVLGYRNLFHEHQWRENNALTPLDKKYLDNYNDWMYFDGSDGETLCKYYDTGDRRYLYQWWDRGADSWYDRIFYKLEDYGDEPIYDE